MRKRKSTDPLPLPLNPGSDEARRRGCRCNPVLNQYGRGEQGTTQSGAPRHITHPLCLLHGEGRAWAYQAPPADPSVPDGRRSPTVHIQRGARRAA